MALLRLTLCGLLALLSACTSPPERHRPPPDRADPPMTVTRHELPRLGAGPHEASLPLLLRRAGSGRQPVIVYLPGLGQDLDGGGRWAAAWVSAGYAVVTLQPLEADAEAWRSELARTGEFTLLGQRHFGEPLRSQRLAALQDAVAQLRALRGPPWADLDWDHAAVAGYETGAQTALDAAQIASAAWQPRAVIAISPLPDTARPALLAPALLISSDADGDPLGLIQRPAERRRAFEQLAGPEPRDWLALHGIPHAGLAGTLPPEAIATQDQRKADAAARAPVGNGRRGGQGNPGPEGARPPGQLGAVGGFRSGSASEAARADLREAWRMSVAFLDAHLLGDAGARERLEQGPEPGKASWLRGR